MYLARKRKAAELEKFILPNSAARFRFLLLSQRECTRRNIEGGCAAAHADLAGVRRISADGAITLASSAPEHISQHSRAAARSGCRNGGNEIVTGFLIRTGKWAYAIRTRVVANGP